MALVDFGDLVRAARAGGQRLSCVEVAGLADLEAAVTRAQAAAVPVVLRLAVSDTPAFRALVAAAERRAGESVADVVIAGVGVNGEAMAVVAVNAGCNGLLADAAGMAACRAVAGACGVTVLEGGEPVLADGFVADAPQGAVKSWTPVDHVIVYNVQGTDDQGVARLMAEGKRALSTIPGVRWVETGTAVTEGAKFRHCWLVRFVHEDVIASYRDHPAHVAFADNWFRPVAGDRITIDFRAR